MMQIERLVLYSKSGEQRELEFRLGKLNVITGASQTGKSSLTNIFRYCLGSSQAGVPIGAISSSVAWYGLVVVTDPDRRHFLGRPAPEDKGDVSDAMLIVEPEGLPTFDQLTPNTTRTELREYLGNAIGIEENLNVPAIGQTRRPLAANFRHSLYYCFQGQGEIANPDVLFHHQNRDWQSQAIKNTLPYFLGAQDLDDLRRRQELKDRRRELRKAEQKLTRAEDEEVTGVERAEALLLEASNAALVDKNVVGVGYDTSESVHAALRSIVDHPIEQDQADTIGVGFEDLRAELAVQRDRARDITHQLRGLDDFDSVAEHYKSELTEHRSRLASIELIPEAIVDAPCPVCGKQIGDEHDSDSNEIASELAKVASRLKLAQRDKPRVEQAKSGLREERRKTLDRIDELNASLTTLAETNELVARERQRVNLQSYVRGKVAQYLESLVSTGPTDLDAIRTATKKQRDSVAALEGTFDPALVRSRVDSALSHVNRDLTDLAQQLELEHAEHGVRLDPNRLTVVADPPSGPPAYLDAGQIGSGLNWVGYHLATYLSMQTFFIKNRRPVPRFVLIDQPSQAFFPSDRAEGGDLDELTDTDRENTKRLYRLMNNRVQELSGSLQLIVLDHADFDDDWFDLCVVERWRDGNALIPASWLNQVGQAETDGENRPDANDA